MNLSRLANSLFSSMRPNKSKCQIADLDTQKGFNPFSVNVLILCPLKKVFWCFQGVYNGNIDQNVGFLSRTFTNHRGRGKVFL